MKLIFCPSCLDVVNLIKSSNRKCLCGNSWGIYCEDGISAVIGGKAIPIGFSNSSFVAALQLRPEEGMGSSFEAFVIPKKCPTVKVQYTRTSLG